jgi:tetratricopeptide (TPR) repeat protein
MKIKKYFSMIIIFIASEIIYPNKIDDSRLKVDNKFSLIDSLQDYKYTQPERAITFASRVLQRKKYASGAYPKVESAFYNHLGEIYLRMNLPSQALSYYIEAKRLLPNQKTPWLDVQFGNVYFNQENWIKAKESYNKALEIFSSNKILGDRLDGKRTGGNSVAGMSTSYSNLGKIEIQLNNYESALAYFELALEMRESHYLSGLENHPTEFGALTSVLYQHFLIADLYFKWEMNDLAKEKISYIDSIAIPIYNMNKLDPLPSKDEGLRGLYRVLGFSNDLKIKIYTLEKKYKQAKQASILARMFLKDWPIYLSRSHSSSAKMYFEQDSLYEALEQIDLGIRICQLKGLNFEELELLKYKMELFEKSNLNKSAISIALKVLEKKRIIENLQMSGMIESVEIKSDLYESRTELLKAKRQQGLLQILIGVLILITGLILISYRNKKRHSEQVAIINEQENQLTQVELKNKEAELVSLSTYALSKNDLLINIIKDLEYHTTLVSNKEDAKSLKPLKKKIQSYIDDGVDWEDYKVQFTNVYPNFVDSLVSYNPDITNSDIKLCCYLKMNMNTKDIAQLFGLTVRAIENKRYRLRKKLFLDKETSLMTFINGLN